MAEEIAFGKYMLREELGRGGFGTIYRATDTSLHIERAVKILHPAFNADPVFIERFRQEARTAARLDHPNIVPIYELGQHEGSYFLVMRLMRGGSLKDLLEKEGLLDPDRAATMLDQIAAGLDFAHNIPERLVHRDIKPGNILLEEDGTARISDFGFSKALEGASSISLSATGGMIGTPPYMAPELWKGEPVDHTADIYSMACMAFEMLTGRLLFTGNSPAQVMTRHVLYGPQFEENWPQDLPNELLPTLNQALAGEPADRFQDAGTFATAVRNALTARPDTTPQKTVQSPEPGLITSPEKQPSGQLEEVVPVALPTATSAAAAERGAGKRGQLPDLSARESRPTEKSPLWRKIRPRMFLAVGIALILIVLFGILFWEDLLWALNPGPEGVVVTHETEASFTGQVGGTDNRIAQPTPVDILDPGQTLQTVQARGYLICGGNATLPGFGLQNEDGEYSGFDIDFCRAIAAAVFGDVSKVEIRPLNASERFTALQSGAVDVLIRNTTWNFTRDASLGGQFVQPIFYDGQGIMVRQDSGINSLEDLAGGVICVQAGTTTELNLSTYFGAQGISIEPAVFLDSNETLQAYAEGRCDGITSDRSALIGYQSLLPEPDSHIILGSVMSKEPLSPMVRNGDDEWYDLVQWVVFATISAEELGITSKNVETLRETSSDGEIRRLLGLDSDLGKNLGLNNDWAYQVIYQVGNYGEIYDRHFGSGSLSPIPRDMNNLWTNGGLLYAPPFR